MISIQAPKAFVGKRWPAETGEVSQREAGMGNSRRSGGEKRIPVRLLISRRGSGAPSHKMTNGPWLVLGPRLDRGLSIRRSIRSNSRGPLEELEPLLQHRVQAASNMVTRLAGPCPGALGEVAVDVECCKIEATTFSLPVRFSSRIIGAFLLRRTTCFYGSSHAQLLPCVLQSLLFRLLRLLRLIEAKASRARALPDGSPC
uniref:Uncharacterized protein n=1 Tax=Ananas comosus var. bracteatus TaxID=296719 RepID=A0A6V7QKI3_ANACO|nr:unnamed protein product [Ananas comosus var. bracteatus]